MVPAAAGRVELSDRQRSHPLRLDHIQSLTEALR
jgi:hypothetical protein